MNPILILTVVIFLGVIGFLLGRARGRGTLRTLPYRDPRLILPIIPAPPPGTQLVEIRATNRVTEGHAVRASVIGENGPVAGVELQLIERNSNQVAERATTDANGAAFFAAPAVQAVTNFEVEIGTSGFAYYLPDTDPRTWDYNLGYYPEVNVTVVPTGFAPVVVNSPKVWVDVAGGWTMPTANMDGLEGACGTAGYEFDEDWWVGDETMFDHARELGPDDIWVLGGHGIDKDGNPLTSECLAGWRPGALLIGYTEVKMADICAAFGPNGAPGIVYLDACSSHSLLDELVECCVRMAVGYDRSVSARASSAASALFVETLLAGGTVQQAKNAAETKVNQTLSGGTGANVVIRTKGWIKDVSSKTLAQVQRATSGNDYWSEFAWEDLSIAEQAVWTELGWDQEFWDEGLKPDTEEKLWEELSESQQRALRSLGYDKATWEE